MDTTKPVQNTKPWYVGVTGATASTRHEASRFARDLLSSEPYRESLTKRVANGTLPPAIEAMLWHYAYGKPPETVHIVPPSQQDLSSTPTQDMIKMAELAAQHLRQADEVDQAVDELSRRETPTRIM